MNDKFPKSTPPNDNDDVPDLDEVSRNVQKKLRAIFDAPVYQTPVKSFNWTRLLLSFVGVVLGSIIIIMIVDASTSTHVYNRPGLITLNVRDLSDAQGFIEACEGSGGATETDQYASNAFKVSCTPAGEVNRLEWFEVFTGDK